MRNLLVLILLALITVKAVAVIALGPVPIERDAWGYWKLSTLVMSGDWLMLADPIAYRTPIYPWFLAILRAIAGEYALPVIAIAQSVLMVASIGIAGQIAARITRLPNAMVWTLLLTLPAVSAFTYNAALLSESLFIFLLMMHLLMMLHYDEEPSATRAVLGGLTFGLVLLTRPIVLLLWLVHIPFVLWSHYRRRKRVGKDASERVKLHGRVSHGMLAAFAAIAIVTPWIARNAIVFDEPFITQFVGRNLWVVTFQDGSGAGLDLPATESSERLQQRFNRTSNADADWRLTWTVSNALIESGLSDPQTDRLMQQVSLDAIKSDQPTFAYKAFRRTVNFWRAAATQLPAQGMRGNYLGESIWIYRIPALEAAIKYRLSQSVLLNTLLTGMIVVAGIVLLINRPSRPYAFWVLMILAYFAVITGVFEIPHYRYRIVVEPLTAALGGGAIAVLLSRRRKPASVITSS